MDLYTGLKFVHVVAATLWVGGNLVFALLAFLARHDRARQLDILRQVSALGFTVFLPSSLVLFLTGGILIWVGAWGADLWIVGGLAAAAGSFVLGAAVLGPTLAKVMMLADSGEPDWALELAGSILWVARVEQALLILAVALMVTKPGWEALPVFGILAAILVAALAGLGLREARATLV